jgi:hypothetical protein
MSILIFYSNGFCTDIKKENTFSGKSIKEPKKKNPKKENLLSEDDLKRLTDNAYTPNKKTIKSIDQDKDIIFFEKQK